MSNYLNKADQAKLDSHQDILLSEDLADQLNDALEKYSQGDIYACFELLRTSTEVVRREMSREVNLTKH